MSLRTLIPTLALMTGGMPLLAEDLSPAPVVVPAEAVGTPIVVVTGTLDEIDVGSDRTETMTSYQLDRFEDYSAGHAIKRMTGVTHSGPPGEVKDVRVRGFDKGFTLITIDGLPTATGKNEDQLQMDRLPPDMIERIELRHVPTADQSHDAIAGTVNVVLKQIPNESSLGVGMQIYEHGGEVGLGATASSGGWLGNVGLFGALAIRQRPFIKDDIETTYLADGSLKESKPKAEDNDITNIEFSPRMTWLLMPAVTVNVNGFVSYLVEDKAKTESKYNVSGILTEAKDSPEVKDASTARLSSDVIIGPQDNQTRLLAGAAYATDNKDARSETVSKFTGGGAPNGRDEKDIPQEDKEETWYFAQLTHDTRPIDAVGLRWGGDWTRKEYTEDKAETTRKYNATDTLTSTEIKHDTFDNVEYGLDAFALARISVGDHVLIPGIRGEVRTTRTASSSEKTTITGVTTATSLSAHDDGISVDVLPSLHHHWQMSEVMAWHSAVARLVRRARPTDRSPIVTESTSNSLTSPDTAGNPDLDPEHAWSMETGISYETTDDLVCSATFYGHWLEDLVEQRTGLEGSRYVQRPQNVGDGYVLGGEAAISTPVPGVNGFVVWTNVGMPLVSNFVDAATGEERRMREQPKWVANAGVDQQLLADRLTLAASIHIRGELEKVEASKVETEEVFYLVDLSATWRFDQIWEIQATASNVTDTIKKKTTTNTANGEVTYREEDGNPTFILGVRATW